MKRVNLLIVTALLFVFFGCKEEIPTPTPPIDGPNLVISVKHGFDNQTLHIDSTVHINAAGNDVRFSAIRYILSSFELRKTNGETVKIPDTYAYFNAADADNHLDIPNFPAGDYDQISFKLGLDSVVNHGDYAVYPANHPLNPLFNQLYWGWQGGYVFIAIEGQFAVSLPQPEFFFYHIATVPLATNYTLPLNMKMENGVAKTINLNFDAAKIFKSPFNIDLNVDGTFTHSGPDDVLAAKVQENLKDAFTLISVQ